MRRYKAKNVTAYLPVHVWVFWDYKSFELCDKWPPVTGYISGTQSFITRSTPRLPHFKLFTSGFNRKI